MKRVYLDTETTGLTPGQICQMTYIVEENDTIVKRVNQYLKVDFIEPGTSEVTGLTLDLLAKLSDGKVFADRAQEFYNDLKDALVIGHNVDFDEKFVSAEMERLRLSMLFMQKFCTMKYFMPILNIPGKYGIKKPKLSEVIQSMGITNDEITDFTHRLYGNYDVGFHDARYDTVGVYLVVRKALALGALNLEDYCKNPIKIDI